MFTVAFIFLLLTIIWAVFALIGAAFIAFEIVLSLLVVSFLLFLLFLISGIKQGPPRLNKQAQQHYNRRY